VSSLSARVSQPGHPGRDGLAACSPGKHLFVWRACACRGANDCCGRVAVIGCPRDDEESVSRDESLLRAAVAGRAFFPDHVSARRFAERLPPDLIIGAEEEVVAIGAGERATTYRPDVQVREPWTLREPAAAEVAATPLPMPATDPIRFSWTRRSNAGLRSVSDGRAHHRARAAQSGNKLEADERDRYRRKRRAFVSAG